MLTNRSRRGCHLADHRARLSRHAEMYVQDFEAFYAQAEELYRARPLDTRYCIKYRHCDGKLVLKVTDDRTVRSLPQLPASVADLPPSCRAAAAGWTDSVLRREVVVLEGEGGAGHAGRSGDGRSLARSHAWRQHGRVA